MEIAWFTDTWLPTRDGVVTSLLSFKKILEKEHNIYIFAPGEENKQDNNIFYYKSKPFSKYPDYRIPPIYSIFSKRTFNIIKRIKPDIIHSHSPGILGTSAVISSYKFNIPLLFTYHTFVEDSVYLLFSNEKMQEIAKRLFYKWLKWYFRRCSCVIVPSLYTKRRLENFASNIRVISTGIDIDRFRNADGEKIRKEYEDKKLILHVGRIVKEKNIDIIIDAAPYIIKKMDAIFIIVGEGPAKKELIEKVRRRGLEKYFVFTGFVNDDELPCYYKASDVFVFPSTYETQGIVAFEAMASGVPIVAARAKAIPNFIRDGYNGYLFNPYDARELAEKVLMAMDNQNKKIIVKNAMEFVKRYSIEKMAEKLVEVYEEWKR